MPPVVNIDLVTRIARKYQNDIRYLPYAILIDTIVNELQISLLPGIENEDTVTTFLRKRGIAKPLFAGVDVKDSDVGKAVESTLKIENAYASVEDDIQNYKEKIVIRPGEMLGTNKTKKHPYQLQIIMSIIRTFSEDILDALFPAERNTADESPMGLFDGFETKLLNAIADNLIHASEKNIVDSGLFPAATATTYEAYTNLVNWLRQANKYLKRNANLYLPTTVAQNCVDGLQVKTNQKAETFVDFVKYLNMDVPGRTNINVIATDFMGDGDRINLTAPGNMEFGFNTLGDNDFVQVRDINKNPNVINYWIQAGYGTRWITHHEKVFFTNTGSLTANELSGDYVS